MYIKISLLMIDEDPEVWKLCEEDGTVIAFGTKEEMLDDLEIWNSIGDDDDQS